MASRRWISAAFLAASSAVLPGSIARSQVATPPAVTPTNSPAASDAPADPDALVDRNLAALNDHLIEPSPPNLHDEAAIEQQREEAARRLLSRPSAHTTQLLQAALKKSVSRLAVVRAIANDPQPDASFIVELLPLLGGERAVNDEAARALARFGDNAPVRGRLTAFALDANQPASLRIGVIRALGEVVKPDVVDALIALLTDPKQGLAVQNAAADALARLTGDSTNGRDGALWKAWQARHVNMKEIDWWEEMLAARDNRRTQEERGQAEFINELKRISDEQYERADLNGKHAMMMRLLNSAEPHVRDMGVQKVADAQVNAIGLPPAALPRLEDMIGDSDADVRLHVASVIDHQNDTHALDAILTQLPQEPNVDVKIALIDALITMNRLRAIKELRLLLLDASIRVATKAAEALKALAPTLRVQDPAQAHKVAGDLWQVGGQRAAEAGGEAFRAATIEAVGALHDRGQTLNLLDLLDSKKNPPRIRSAALHALGDIGEHTTAFQIAHSLDTDPVAAVRIDAIGAYGKTNKFEDAADELYRVMSPNNESDPAVRERAWVEFQSLLPSATQFDVLDRWATVFQNDPVRRLAVLTQLNLKYRKELRWEDLALSRQNTGETYMQAPLSDPARAALEFEAALDYWQKQGVANPVTVQLVQQFFAALFAARQYDKAAALAGKQITRDRTQQGSIGGMLKDEVNRLFDEGVRDNDPQKLKDGKSLIDAALKMQPPLDERFLSDLRQYQKDIEARLKTLPGQKP